MGELWIKAQQRESKLVSERVSESLIVRGTEIRYPFLNVMVSHYIIKQEAN